MVYFDYAATTPVDPMVLEAMLPFLNHQFGNAASSHIYGETAKKAVEQARGQVAALLKADASEIIFTSGATEANNLALKGVTQLYQHKGKHIITLKTEHPSVLATLQHLEKQGFLVTYLPVNAAGVLEIHQLEQALRADTMLVSIMHVNNEIGVIQDIAQIAEWVKAHGLLLHVDAAQSVGKFPLDLTQIPIDLLSISAHKLYGPKGIGALYVRNKPRVRVAAQIHGGGQEAGMRSGTLPVHQIVGMGAACAVAQQKMASDYAHVSALRDYLLQKNAMDPAFIVNGDVDTSYPGILNIRLIHTKPEQLSQAQIAFSQGSACHSHEPNSTVLHALGLSSQDALNSVRLSFGRFTTMAEMAAFFALIQKNNP